MIKIKMQDANHQYDEQDRAITTWDSKKCTWIVNTEFENEKIDWWGQDNDFPRGCTLSDFIENNPDWDKKPDIVVTWTWNTKQSMMSGFRDSNSEWYNKHQFPYSESRDWDTLTTVKKKQSNT